MASARPVQARPLDVAERLWRNYNKCVTYDPEGRTGGSTMRYTFESTDLSPATFLDLTSIRDFCMPLALVSLDFHVTVKTTKRAFRRPGQHSMTY